jgi:4'-phosphopantetheinyl transferase
MPATPRPWPASLAAALGPEIRLWRIDLDVPPGAEALAILDAQERQRAARFVFDHHRRRFQAAHAVTRTLLAESLGCRPADISYAHGPHGKPHIVGPVPAAQAGSFNLSHSDDLALLLWSPAGGDWGIDIERIRAVTDADDLAPSKPPGGPCRKSSDHGASCNDGPARKLA